MIFDLARQWQWNFQDPASALMEGLIDLHHNILFILLIIFGAVTFLMLAILKDTSFIWIFPGRERILRQKQYLRFSNINHGTTLEIVWTLVPSLILFCIAIPSFSLLYSMEEILDPQITIKAVAAQWFWTYEYGNLDLHWTSYMRVLSDMKPGQPRLLCVDNPLFLPLETNIRFLIASNDVIHAFAIPSLGLKVDAVPGRLNQLSCYINRPGIFYGSCSELCGANHAFMPLEAVTVIMCTIPIVGVLFNDGIGEFYFTVRYEQRYFKRSGIILGTMRRYHPNGYLMKADDTFFSFYYTDFYYYSPELDKANVYRLRVDIVRVYYHDPDDHPVLLNWLKRKWKELRQKWQNRH